MIVTKSVSVSGASCDAVILTRWKFLGIPVFTMKVAKRAFASW